MSYIYLGDRAIPLDSGRPISFGDTVDQAEVPTYAADWFQAVPEPAPAVVAPAAAPKAPAPAPAPAPDPTATDTGSTATAPSDTTTTE